MEELANTEIARQTGEAADGDVVGEDDLATLDFAPPLSILDVNKFKVGHIFYMIMLLNIHILFKEENNFIN